MKIVTSLDDICVDGATVLTIGAFDGVHRGHQALVSNVVERARKSGRQSGVITFHPHPLAVLRPETPVQYISTPGERATLFERLGVDMLLLLPFTPELASRPAPDFVAQLAAHLRPAEIWVGPDFALGKGRAGDVGSLRRLGEEMGFTLHVMPPVELNGGVVSSSRIRQALIAGQMDAAAEMLGRFYSVCGVVIAGQHRGRLLGFPTANVHVNGKRTLPPDGVYAAFAVLDGERLPAVINLGVRPTFDAGERLLEAYIMDQAGPLDLYGREIVVEFVKRLRAELKFDAVSALIAQMHDDVRTTREVLAGVDLSRYEPAPSECGR